MRSRKVGGAGSAGTLPGLSRAQMAMKPMNSAISMTPGRTPAMNRRAIDSSMATP